jgi:DNA (cytosine-5)-methyltransferase 1
MPIPIIDLFAGPGGLNEGFSRVRDAHGARVFGSVISVEMEHCAHKTLELRALYRRLHDRGEVDSYYSYVGGEITREKLFEEAKDLGVEAKAEATKATLGLSETGNLEIERKIEAALKRAGSQECVLIGGPPCQAYSLAGRARRTNDEHFEEDHKHTLYREYLNIVRKFRPAVFVMENVPGLLSATHKGQQVFERICSDLRAAGYSLHPACPPANPEKVGANPKDFVVHAEHYGVPQARSRVFIIGLRSDLGLRPVTLPKQDERNLVTVGDVIGDLPRIRSRLSKEPDSAENWLSAITEPFTRYKLTELEKHFHARLKDRLSVMSNHYPLGRPVVRRSNDGPERLRRWFISAENKFILNHNSRGHMRSDLLRYFFWAEYAAHYGRSPSVQDVPQFLRPHHKNLSLEPEKQPFIDRFRVQLKGRPSSTVVSHIAKDGHYYIHYEPKQCRSLSVREAARLQTFPDNYFFEGAITDQYRQAGNAVPPFLANQIAEIILAMLSGQRGPTRQA